MFVHVKHVNELLLVSMNAYTAQSCSPCSCAFLIDLKQLGTEPFCCLLCPRVLLVHAFCIAQLGYVGTVTAPTLAARYAMCSHAVWFTQVYQARKVAYRPADYPGRIYEPDTHRLCTVPAGGTVAQVCSIMHGNLMMLAASLDAMQADSDSIGSIKFPSQLQVYDETLNIELPVTHPDLHRNCGGIMVSCHSLYSHRAEFAGRSGMRLISRRRF